MELLEGTAEIGMGKNVDDIAFQSGLDRGLDVVLFEELGHLADLGDEHETAHLGVEILHRVDKLQHKP